uniref:Peptidase S54 rhomboid domain-containing protein n=1 Tax=Aegilops tauschii subsp. strangulata TaxID=200361 RepID=A0A453PYF6_AEGTS
SAWNNVDPMFMRKHFMIGAWLTSLDNFTSGRLHTMLTSSFSHMDLKHLFNNMVGLYFFGSSIARTFGPGFLFQLYVTGALTGSVFYLAEKIFLAPRKEVFGGWKTPCLGASAAVNAIILLEIFLHPTKLLYLHLFIPVPAALMGVGLIGADLWRVKKGESRVSGSSHLGGALVAAAAFAEIKGWI